MTAEELVDKIVIECSIDNDEASISGIVEIYLGRKPDTRNIDDYKYIYEVCRLINKFSYGKSTSKDWNYYKILPEWVSAKEHGGHFVYQKYLEQERNAERIYKEDGRTLRWYEKENAKQVFDDYPKVKNRADLAIAISIILVFLELLKWIVELLRHPSS